MVTSGYVMQGLPNPDGHISIDPGSYSYSSAGNLMARLGNSLTAFNINASGTTILDYDLSKILLRYGMQDDSQMQFGTNSGASGAAANALLPGVLDISPYSRTPRPPVASANVFGAAGNAKAIAKGIAVKNVTLAYQIFGAALTSASVGIYKFQHINNAAVVASNILPVAQNGLVNAFSANPYLITVPIPTANQTMLTSRFARYTLELQFVAPAGCTGNLYGIFLDVAYNYN